MLRLVGRMAAAIPPMVDSAHPAKDDETSPKVVVERPPPPEAARPAPEAARPTLRPPLADGVALWRAHIGQ